MGEAAGNWEKVHRLLVEFNKRPIVTVEGEASGDSEGKNGPRVEAVFAGHARVYCKGIHAEGRHWLLCAGAFGQMRGGDAAAGQLQHYTEVHVDTSGVHLVASAAGNVLPDDFVVARDREVLTKNCGD